MILDFRKGSLSLFGDLFSSILWETVSGDKGFQDEFQGQSPQTRGTVLSSAQESKKTWRKASMGELGAPV